MFLDSDRSIAGAQEMLIFISLGVFLVQTCLQAQFKRSSSQLYVDFK